MKKNLKILLSKVKDQLDQRSLPQKRGWGWVLFVKKNEIKMESTNKMERRILSVHVCIIKRNLLSDPKT